MKLIGTALLKKTAVIVGLLMPVCGYAVGIDVNWTGPKQLTIRAQPDGVGGSSNVCKTGTTVYFYAVLNNTIGNRQRMVASAPGIPSGLCSQVLESRLPIVVNLQNDEYYFFGFSKTINNRMPDGGVSITLEYQSGTGNGWKPQPPPGPACSLTGSLVYIDYGDIQASSVPGMKKSSNLSIRCTSTATVEVKVLGYTSSGIKLRTDGSLAADVFVRDQPANVGSLERISANQTIAVPISSVLKVNGNLAGGAFSGSAVINVDIK